MCVGLRSPRPFTVLWQLSTVKGSNIPALPPKKVSSASGFSCCCVFASCYHPKQWFGNMDRDFVEQRRQQLQVRWPLRCLLAMHCRHANLVVFFIRSSWTTFWTKTT